MKKIITLLLFSIINTFCSGQGSWNQKTTCQGNARYRAIAFAVNGKCYMGTGSMGGGITQNLKDLWEFNPDVNSWTQKTDLPGPPRTNAAASSAGNYGYVGLGSNKGTLLNDWWQYDPVGNSWLAMTNYPGIPRYGCGSFSIQDIIYTGGGLDSANHAQSDMYAYDPVNNSWTPKAALPVGVSSAAAFALGQKGYFVAGASTVSINGTTQTAEYNPANDTWTTRAPYPGGNTFSAIGFSLFGIAYVGTGFTGNITDEMWSYNPVTNVWAPETFWPTGIRQWAVSCVANNKAYVGTGNSTGGLLFSDWWEFLPDLTTSNKLEINTMPVSASFDAVRKEILIKNTRGNETIKIFNMEGKLLFEHSACRDIQFLQWDQNGIFLVAIFDRDKIYTKKINCIN